MALQISYTDKRGVANTEAYVKINAVEIDSVLSTATIKLGVYHNVAARSKSDESQKKATVQGIEYIIYGDDFSTYLAESVIKATDKSALTQAYAWLKQHVDTGTGADGDDRFNHSKGINWTTATDV